MLQNQDEVHKKLSKTSNVAQANKALGIKLTNNKGSVYVFLDVLSVTVKRYSTG